MDTPPTDTRVRVIRGASLACNDQRYARACFRDWSPLLLKDFRMGFRTFRPVTLVVTPW